MTVGASVFRRYGFSDFLTALLALPVLGGAGIAMFGMVAASGIKTLSKVQFDGIHNIMVVAVSIGVGMITLAVPNFYQNFPSWAQVILHSGITAGSVTAIILNAALNGTDKPGETAIGKQEYIG
ncbi:solute carrier family 23 protein [Sporomusa ovata]|uniref:Xanthine permease n=1 Tax=Sporomusa ovata TaxID=2378 RepID=A0A0U1KUT2_9FIRM|nr:solute carrier family 23 protein [Sporomusa ovata]CQR70663.1 Xanthine permease [Sporomusa ovata]